MAMEELEILPTADGDFAIKNNCLAYMAQGIVYDDRPAQPQQDFHLYAVLPA